MAYVHKKDMRNSKVDFLNRIIYQKKINDQWILGIPFLIPNKPMPKSLHPKKGSVLEDSEHTFHGQIRF